MEHEAISVVNSIMGKLTSLLTEEVKLLMGVHDEIKFMKDELAAMHAFLENMSTMEKNKTIDAQLKQFTKEVRDKAFDAEEVIDDFMELVDAEPSSKGSTFQRLGRKIVKPFKTLKPKHEIANQIKQLKEQVEDVAKRRSRFGVTIPTTVAAAASEAASNTRLQELRQRLPALRTKYVDHKGRKKRLIRLLRDPKVNQLRVISITGFGGTGKTTLAKKAYDQLAEQFQCRAFVIVSQKFDFHKLLRSVLQQVSGDDAPKKIKRMDYTELIDELKKKLKKKRYVIVLDDMWNREAWEHLKSALPDDGNGSRVLITTRDVKLAKTFDNYDHDYTYYLDKLSEDESNELFFERVFDDVNGCPDNLKDVAKKILAKCHGVPLAILSIAGVLRHKYTVTDWNNVHKGIGTRPLKADPILEEVTQILKLSFDELPSYLKVLMLYLSIYPEDYKIDREAIMCRWISEGLVSEMNHWSAEERANSCFDELIDRNVILVGDVSFDDKVESCRVHDMMLEFIVQKSDEENIVSVFHPGCMVKAQEKVRRLSVHKGTDLKQELGNLKLDHLRSLTMFSYVKTLLTKHLLKRLKVLDLEGCIGIEKSDMERICELFLLKYLSIRNTDVEELPAQIKNLQELEGLDIVGSNIKKLPPEFSELQNLRHLICTDVAIPDGLEKLLALEELRASCSDGERLQAIGKLTKLKNVTVWSDSWNCHCEPTLVNSIGKLNGSLLSLSICNLHGLAPSLHYLDSDIIQRFDGPDLGFLDSLSPAPVHLQRLCLVGSTQKLPNWIASLSHITFLDLYINSILDDSSLQALGKLHSLLYLRLHQRPMLSSLDLSLGVDGRSALKKVDVGCKQGLHLRFGATPNLERIIAYSTRGTVTITGIEKLPALEEVELSGYKIDRLDELKHVLKQHSNKPILKVNNYNTFFSTRKKNYKLDPLNRLQGELEDSDDSETEDGERLRDRLGSVITNMKKISDWWLLLVAFLIGTFLEFRYILAALPLVLILGLILGRLPVLKFVRSLTGTAAGRWSRMIYQWIARFVPELTHSSVLGIKVLLCVFALTGIIVACYLVKWTKVG